MTVVLIHGNPETPVIWEPLVAELADQQVICPQLPGFGCPAPQGFDATKESYMAWLIDELRSIVAEHGPVDAVGHDWGGGVMMPVVSRHPELFRSWTCDVLGLFHRDYVWHDFAHIWQTPGQGEAFMAGMEATPVEQRTAGYVSMGMIEPIARRIVEAADAEMNRCVLALYRSAIQPAMSEMGSSLSGARARPGLALIADDDPFTRDTQLTEEVAAHLGARIEHLPGQGHWWMMTNPTGAAAVLRQFWSSLSTS